MILVTLKTGRVARTQWRIGAQTVEEIRRHPFMQDPSTTVLKVRRVR